MPWKNGLGITNQIDIHPPGSSFPQDKFNWRLSTATITGPNTFSHFPGYDRILVVWTGSGLQLNGDKNLLPLQPYAFPGEEDNYCALIDPDSKVVDYGIMFSRDRVKGSMRVGSEERVTLGPGTHYLTCTLGKFSVAMEPGVCADLGDTLVVNNNSQFESTIQLQLSTEDTKYFHTHLEMIH